MIIIYVLFENKNYYIGMTTLSLHARVLRHKAEKKNNKKCNWIQQLKKENRFHELQYVILEETENQEEANQLEEFYINYFEFLGFNKMNERQGGKSGYNVIFTPEHISHMKKSDQWRLNMSQRMSGKNHPRYISINSEIENEIKQLFNQGITKYRLSKNFNLSIRVITRIVKDLIRIV